MHIDGVILKNDPLHASYHKRGNYTASYQKSTITARHISARSQKYKNIVLLEMR
jgi:hypothetical protein